MSLALELLVDAVDLEEVLRVFGGRVCGVYFEGFGDAGLSYFDGFAVVFGEGSVGERGVEEVDDGER